MSQKKINNKNIKTITNEMKFTYVAKEYKSNFKSNKFPKDLNTQDDNKELENHAVSLDTQITLKKVIIIPLELQVELIIELKT